MKNFGKQSRVLLVMLLAVVMLFSSVSVIAFAADVPEEKNYTTEWYNIEYIPATETKDASVRVMINTNVKTSITA